MSGRSTTVGVLVILMVLGGAPGMAAPTPTAPQDDANDACPPGLVRVKATNHAADRNRNGYVCQAAPAASPGAKATPGPRAKPTTPPGGAKPGDGGAPAKGQIEVIVVDDQAGKCPPGYTLVRNVPTHPADANKNGIVCGKVKGSDD